MEESLSIHNEKEIVCDNTTLVNILIITSSGGSGHLQAAKAISKRYKTLMPHTNIITRDALHHWLGRYIGSFFSKCWNKAQKQGNIKALGRLIALQPIADSITWFPLFCGCLYTLKKENINQIIDTQPIGTSAILVAVRLYQWLYHKEITIEKVLTELPTKHSIHFFNPIRRLSTTNRKILTLRTITPLTENNETEEQFWEKYCKLSSTQISSNPLPLRCQFIKLKKEKFTNKAFNLCLDTKNPFETHLAHKIASFSSLPLLRKKNQINLSIKEEYRITTLMLGGFPNQKTILEYVKLFIQEKKGNTTCDILFIFCSQTRKASIQQSILTLLKTISNYPTTLTIIPLSYQEDHVIAPIFKRSNATITKAGGLTSMEVSTLVTGKVWIHCEDQRTKKFFGSSKIKDGMPLWERGNASYLEKTKNASLVTLSSFPIKLRPYLLSQE